MMLLLMHQIKDFLTYLQYRVSNSALRYVIHVVSSLLWQ